MSDTPKADALKDRYCLHGMDWYLLCGELERENAALREQVRCLKEDLSITRQLRCHDIVESEKEEQP